MKIILKSIQHAPSLSEETNAFSADVYIDGVKAAHARNDGRGGETLVQHYEGHRDLVRKADEWCRALPQDEVELAGKTYHLDQSLHYYVDKLVEEDLTWKDLQKNMRKGVLVAHNGEVVIYKYKPGMTAANKQRWIEQATARGEVVLNGRPRADVLNLIKKQPACAQ